MHFRMGVKSVLIALPIPGLKLAEKKKKGTDYLIVPGWSKIMDELIIAQDTLLSAHAPCPSVVFQEQSQYASTSTQQPL